jgi:hypothetical protein
VELGGLGLLQQSSAHLGSTNGSYPHRLEQMVRVVGLAALGTEQRLGCGQPWKICSLCFCRMLVFLDLTYACILSTNNDLN